MPNQEQINKLIKLLGKGAVNYNYFFSKLNDPSWINPLFDQGLLSDPPPAIKNEKGIVVSAPFWPPSQFLIKMATKAPENVLKIALKIHTDNYFVMRDLTKASLLMPPHLAENWVKHVIQWLQDGNTIYGMLEVDLGKLISKMAKEGKTEVAFKLASILLDVFPDPEIEKKKNPKGEIEEILFSSLKPQIRIDIHDYKRILEKYFSDLTEAAPFETLDMFCNLLEHAIVYSSHEGELNKPHDLTYIRHPAIEDHEQNNDFSVDCILITAVRNAAEFIYNRYPDKIADLVKLIEAHGWNVFQRIGIHILRVTETTPLDMVEKRLVNKKVFDSISLHHEYFHLIKKYFEQISKTGQKKILSWIDDREIKKRYFDKHRKDQTKKQIEKSYRWWQYGKLIPINKYLTGKWEILYTALKNELGDPFIPPDFLSWAGSGTVGPQSPKNSEELAKMSMEELIDFLINWKPTDEWRSPTPGGLGSVLGSLVAEYPDKYAAEVERFMDKNMDPTYVRHLISGFYRAIENGKSLPFELVFKLCKWVIDQPVKIEGRKIPKGLHIDFDIDIDWQITRREISDLFDKLFRGKSDPPYKLRDTIWQILEPLIRDTEPDLVYESKFGGKNMDPLTLSINTIRGRALHGMMRYASWVFDHIKDVIQENKNRSPRLKDIPEVLDVLEKHLTIKVSPFYKNQTDRAVYGLWLPQMIHWDAEWVRANLRHIFPMEPEHRLLREAAWNTFLQYSKIYIPVFDIIRDIYKEEVINFTAKSFKEIDFRSPETHLVEHIVVLYARGKISLGDNDLMTELFHTAPSELTAHVMDFIGRIVAGETPPEPKEIEKFKALWDWRAGHTEKMKKMSNSELAAFGWWFASGKFDENWTFPYLEQVLKRTGIGRSSQKLFEHMSRVFKNYPGQSLRCLRLFIEKNDEPWFLNANKKEGIWQVLEQSIIYQDPEIRQAAEDIVHYLGSKGYLGYRELLKTVPRNE